MNEVWKDIEGYEGLYQVSSEGRVRSCARKYLAGNHHRSVKDRILKLHVNTNGYIHISLRKEKGPMFFRVHRLVATAFIPNPYNKGDVNHKDGVRSNNKATNLEWATRSENLLHKHRILGRPGAQTGKTNTCRSIPVVKLDRTTNEVLDKYPSCSEAARSMGLDVSCGRNIYSVIVNKQVTAYGFKWRLA